ncbi:MAG: hypothetical protein V4438_00620 [Patescibacteria group bacterium]
MKHYSTKDDIKRRLGSFLKHLWIFLRALVPAMIVTLIWGNFEAIDVHFVHEDEAIIIGTIATLGVIYGLLAAITVLIVAERWPKITISVFDHDKRSFLILRDERLAITFNMVTSIDAFFILFIMGGMEYRSPYTGAILMFSVSLVMSMFYVGIRDAQDVSKSQWVRERVPEDWFTENAEIRQPRY